jgi:hypothetical protein
MLVDEGNQFVFLFLLNSVLFCLFGHFELMVQLLGDHICSQTDNLRHSERGLGR